MIPSSVSSFDPHSYPESFSFYEKTGLAEELSRLYTNWSSEIQVHYTSRVTSESFESGLKEFSYKVRPAIVRECSSKEKVFIYEILKVYSLIYNPEVRFMVEDFENLLDQRTFSNNARYFYLKTLKDWQLIEQFEQRLRFMSDSRRKIFRKINNTFGKRKLSFQNLFKYYFLRPFFEIFKPKPKKVQRHKGYRDHGSLGSDWSKTLKDQAGDWSFQEREDRIRKENEDFRRFIRGIHD